MKNAEEVQGDIDWQFQYAPVVAEILSEHLGHQFTPAPSLDDLEMATDFMMVASGRQPRVACRIRRWKYWRDNPSYRNEFTIRATRPQSGSNTELTKTIRGENTHLFYGFAGPQKEPTIHAWLIGDLYVWRLWYMRQLVQAAAGEIPGQRIPNPDGSSHFDVFQIENMPDDFLVARETGHLEATA